MSSRCSRPSPAWSMGSGASSSSFRRFDQDATGCTSTWVGSRSSVHRSSASAWGIFVVIPTIRPGCNWLHEHLGWFPLFSTPLLSVGLLPAALVLTIMILPTVTAISRDAIAAVDPLLREADAEER